MMRMCSSAAATLLVLACGGSPGPGEDGSGDAGHRDDGTVQADGGEPSARIVFATSTLHAGDLGGPEGADEICGARASEAGLSGTFAAWVSTGEISAAQRLDAAPGAIVRSDGVTVTETWADLLSGQLEVPIKRDEKGDEIGGDVWTGTLSDGSSAEDHCEGFTDGSLESSGLCGTTNATGSGWTQNIVPSCSAELRLYCIEQ